MVLSTNALTAVKDPLMRTDEIQNLVKKSLTSVWEIEQNSGLPKSTVQKILKKMHHPFNLHISQVLRSVKIIAFLDTTKTIGIPKSRVCYERQNFNFTLDLMFGSES